MFLKAAYRLFCIVYGLLLDSVHHVKHMKLMGHEHILNAELQSLVDSTFPSTFPCCIPH